MISIKYIRQFRIGGYAIFDLVFVYFGMYLLSPLLTRIFQKIGIDIPHKNWLYLALPIGILVHVLIGQITPMTKNFFNLNDNLILKIIIVLMVIMGLRGIKKI